MQVFWLKYSLDSNFRIEGKDVVSVNTKVQDPFRNDPKNFSANFFPNMIESNELNNLSFDSFVLEQLASDVQVRINAKYGVTDYALNIFDNTKGQVVSKNYQQLNNEVIETSFGATETIVVLATSENVGPIKYFIAPTLDYLIIKSIATLKNGEERVLIISEMPKFLEEWHQSDLDTFHPYPYSLFCTLGLIQRKSFVLHLH